MWGGGSSFAAGGGGAGGGGGFAAGGGGGGGAPGGRGGGGGGGFSGSSSRSSRSRNRRGGGGGGGGGQQNNAPFGNGGGFGGGGGGAFQGGHGGGGRGGGGRDGGRGGRGGRSTGGRGGGSDIPCTSEVTLVAELQPQGASGKINDIATDEAGAKLYVATGPVVRVWDCNTGAPLYEITVDPRAQVNALLIVNGHLFMGAHDPSPGGTTGIIRVLNLAGATPPGNDPSAPHYDLTQGHTGAIYSMVVVNDMLVSAGVTVDKSLLVHKFNTATSKFEPMTTLRGHTADPICLETMGSYVFSGGLDSSIRMWNMANGQCERVIDAQTNGSHIAHTQAVTSMIIWQWQNSPVVISAGLDGLVKVWGKTDPKNPDPNQDPLSLVHTQGGQQGGRQPNPCVYLCGFDDPNGKSVIAASHQVANELRLYELPQFKKRGMCWSQTKANRALITCIASHAIPGQFFTGDENGVVRVWQC